MPRAILIASLSACLSLGGTVHAQERPEPNAVGNGARALSLGYAATAAANDVFAAGWNPAGLALVQRAEIGVSTRALTTWANANVTPGPDEAYARYKGIGEIALALDPVEFVGVAIPVRIGGRRVVAGLAWRRFAEGVRTSRFRTKIVAGRGRFVLETRSASHGGLRALSPSLAVELSPKVRVGATANILHGSATHRIIGPREYTVTRLDVLPGDHFRSTTSETAYGGIALSVGALVDDLLPRTRIGVALTLPHDRHLTLAIDTASRAATFETPLEGAVGVLWTVDENSRLAADIRLAGWARAVLRDDSLGTGIPAANPRRDSRSLHLGYERDVFDHPHRTAVRIGGFYRRTTATDLTGDGVNVLGVSLGDTWRFTRASADFGALLSLSSQWTRSATGQRTVELKNREILVSVAVRRQR